MARNILLLSHSPVARAPSKIHKHTCASVYTHTHTHAKQFGEHVAMALITVEHAIGGRRVSGSRLHAVTLSDSRNAGPLDATATGWRIICIQLACAAAAAFVFIDGLFGGNSECVRGTEGGRLYTDRA